MSRCILGSLVASQGIALILYCFCQFQTLLVYVPYSSSLLVSSLWQQAGRSGRREKPSLSIYVAFEGPLDQYFMKFPHKLFRGSIECCHVDPNNDQVSLH